MESLILKFVTPKLRFLVVFLVVVLMLFLFFNFVFAGGAGGDGDGDGGGPDTCGPSGNACGCGAVDGVGAGESDGGDPGSIGSTCFSGSNPCGHRGRGTVQRDGSCSAVVPSAGPGCGSGFGKGYSQGSYYSQASYYAQGSYLPGESYSQSGYYTQSAYYSQSAYTPPPAFSASAETINAGSVTQLTWSCPLSGSSSGVNFTTNGLPSGSATVMPLETTEYIVSCPVEGQANITITVLDPNLSIAANPNLVRPGSTTQIVWSARNVLSCIVRGPDFVALGIEGSRRTPPINEESTYTLSCSNEAGESSQSVTVKLVPSFEEF